jgi:hypothetical protein
MTPRLVDHSVSDEMPQVKPCPTRDLEITLAPLIASSRGNYYMGGGTPGVRDRGGAGW